MSLIVSLLIGFISPAMAVEVSVSEVGHVYNPVWSPDGSYLAFELNEQAGSLSLYVVQVQNGSLRGMPSRVDVAGSGGGGFGGGRRGARCRVRQFLGDRLRTLLALRTGLRHRPLALRLDSRFPPFAFLRLLTSRRPPRRPPRTRRRPCRGRRARAGRQRSRAARASLGVRDREAEAPAPFRKPVRRASAADLRRRLLHARLAGDDRRVADAALGRQPIPRGQAAVRRLVHRHWDQPPERVGRRVAVPAPRIRRDDQGAADLHARVASSAVGDALHGRVASRGTEGSGVRPRRAWGGAHQAVRAARPEQ